MQQVPCLATRWADEWCNEQDRNQALHAEADDYLNGNPDVANAYAADLAQKMHVDPELMEQEEWNQWVADNWDEIVALFKRKK